MNEQKELSEADVIINRHMARLLTELESANCPRIYIRAVKDRLAWLRADLKEMQEGNIDNGNED